MHKLAKRAVDAAVASVTLAALALPMVLLAVAVRLKLGSPIFFRQPRPGLHGKPFELIKFRTMKNAIDMNCALSSDEVRLTPFGRFLRTWSLDELPELWNVVRGDMSLVGPRPLLVEYLPLYSPEQARRHEVLPGLTGWAQVNGRNAVSWEEKFRLDVWYVDNQSIWLDLKIIVLTIVRVFQRAGINAKGDATMPKFKGTPIVERS